jgi:integrase
VHEKPLQGIARDTGENIEQMIAFDVSIRSGMRRSEQYNLRWPDVEFDRKIMRLPMTKNGKPHNAFIIEDVKKLLSSLCSDKSVG